MSAQQQKMLDDMWAKLEATTISGKSWVDGGKKPSRWRDARAISDSLRSQLGGDAPTPPSGLGSALPVRLLRSPGPVINVATAAQLGAALYNAAYGSIIKLTNDIPGSISWSRPGDPDKVTTVDGDGHKLIGGGVHITGSHFRALDLISENAPTDGFKITYESSNPRGAHHVELESCQSIGARVQGVLITRDNPMDAHHIQVWNHRSIRCGNSSNLDHGIYWAAVGPESLLANFYSEACQAYGVQIYPHASGLLSTMITIRGGRTRGGVVLGSDKGDSNPTSNTITVGLDVEDSVVGAFESWYPGMGNRVYDSSYRRCADGFDDDPGVTFVRCIESAVPQTIDPDRLKYVPPFDIDGKPRVGVVRAGAFA